MELSDWLNEYCVCVQSFHGRESTTMPVKVMIQWRSVCAQDKLKALLMPTHLISIDIMQDMVRIYIKVTLLNK